MEDRRLYDDTGSAVASNDTWSEYDEAAVDGESKSEEIAKNETRNVWRLKLVVLLVLISSAVAVALLTYYYVSGNEINKFEKQFEDDAKKIFEAIGTSLDKTMGLFDSVAVALVTHARFANQTWPFVTLPNFALRMAKIVPPSAAVAINLMPIVTSENRAAWEAYTLANDQWVNEDMAVQATWSGWNGPVEYNGTQNGVIHGDFDVIPANVSRIMLPTWQNFPVTANSNYTYNYDWASTTVAGNAFVTVEKHQAAFSKTYMIPKPGDTVAEAETAAWGEAFRPLLSPEEEPVEPISDFTYPIVDEVRTVLVAGAKDYNPADHKIVGILGGAVYWRALIRNILPEGSDGIRVVFTSPCNEPFTYQINGPMAKYMGVGDFHDKKYDGLGIHSRLKDTKKYAVLDTGYSGAMIDQDFCPNTVHLYPSKEMRDKYTSNDAILFAISALSIFAFTSLVFLLYDYSVERRQETVMTTAVHSSAIVSSLFPADVRDRLFPINNTSPKSRKTQPFLNDGCDKARHATPIAQLYPDTTVYFADIAGFTAWSSARQPTHVFQLLETLYSSFDEIARRRGVFKVETIGDCYVAVVGLPIPRKHHAVVMARFAADCRSKMKQLTLGLEKSLGPGTTDLALRFGLHSGPTTAGVLRGDKARFQLFGDTVNTAARMESNGERDRIHVSEKTAGLIKLAGKGHWLLPREDKIHAKGKGLMTTYWCEPTRGSESVSACSSEDAEIADNVEIKPEDALKRLVDWNVEMFEGLLRNISAQKNGGRKSAKRRSSVNLDQILRVNRVDEDKDGPTESLDDNRLTQREARVTKAVLEQLRQLITNIADQHKSRPFDNFERCTHVVMATKRLVDGIVSHESSEIAGLSRINRNAISTDAQTRFAVVFAALIRNISHPGVSNDQLGVNESELVAESHSIGVAWDLLMEPQYSDLRNCIYSNKTEAHHIRHILTNAVLAADSWDGTEQSARETRWETLLGEDLESTDEGLNDRLTIVVELILQAADLSYTMQHFTVYQKWNDCRFAEQYAAFQSGQSAGTDPRLDWYDVQLELFHRIVIPLAQTLKTSGMFGSASDELLTFAQENRVEWEMKGREIVRVASTLYGAGGHCS